MEQAENNNTGYEEQVYGIIKVGERGQLTLPVGALDAYDIRPGDRLVVMGNREGGLVLVKAELFSEE